jgi:hypothetical protein
MERKAFIAQLDELKHRMRIFLWRVGTGVFLLNFAIIAYVFHRYPPPLHSASGLDWYLVAFALTSITLITFKLLSRRIIARYAPVCPSCGTVAIERERSLILDSGLCPKCGSEFVHSNP